jgi:hypothetical protein
VSFLNACSLFSLFLRDHVEAIDPFKQYMRQRLFKNENCYGLAGAMVGPLDGVRAGTGGAARGGERARSRHSSALSSRYPRTSLSRCSSWPAANRAARPSRPVIAVLAVPARRWTLHRPLAEVDDDLVISLLTHGRIRDLYLRPRRYCWSLGYNSH